MFFKLFDIHRFTNKNLYDFVERKNTLYGAWNPAVTNVIWTHGHLDPWRAMGIQTDLNRHATAIVIPGKFVRQNKYFKNI